MPINQTKISDSELTYSWLYHSIYVDKNIDAEDVRWALSEIGIEYVYIQGDMIDNSYYNVDIVENYGYVYSLK